MDGQQAKLPRQEHYGDMWTTTFCPSFTIWSFTFLNVIVQLIVFIATLFYTQSSSEQGFTPWMFLGNTPECMKTFGMRMPFLIKEGEVWRLFLSLYVNHGFSQVVVNCLAQLFAGLMLEAQMGSLRMAFFWFTAGIGANLFAATAEDLYAAGAEPAMFALISGLLAMFIYYWERIHCENWCMKVCGFFMMIFLLVIGIFFLTSFAAPYKNYMKLWKISYPDSMGFLGGFLFGMPLTWVFLPSSTGSFKTAPRLEKGLFYFGLIMALAIFCIVVAAFLTGTEPK